MLIDDDDWGRWTRYVTVIVDGLLPIPLSSIIHVEHHYQQQPRTTTIPQSIFVHNRFIIMNNEKWLRTKNWRCWMMINADGWRRLNMMDKICHDNRRWAVVQTLMIMVVAVASEDASIFINHRRWFLVLFLTFIRFFSIGTLIMVVVIVGERRSRLFTIDDPLVWLIHFSTPFLRMIHSTTALPIVCISGMEQMYEHH